MEWTISSEHLAAVIAAARAALPLEACGLLLGEGRSITAILPAANVAADAARAFEVSPATLLAAHRRARAGGPAVIGSYHSHPGGDPLPSRTDAAAAAPDGQLWLIVAGDDHRAWAAVAAGIRHGRFDPVALRVI